MARLTDSQIEDMKSTWDDGFCEVTCPLCGEVISEGMYPEPEFEGDGHIEFVESMECWECGYTLTFVKKYYPTDTEFELSYEDA